MREISDLIYSISPVDLQFAGLLLFDTQRVIKMAEEYPEHPEEKALPPFDPMTTSLGLFFKTVQLFVFLSFARDMSKATGIMQ